MFCPSRTRVKSRIPFLNRYDYGIITYHSMIPAIDPGQNKQLLNTLQSYQNQILSWLGYIQHDSRFVFRLTFDLYLNRIPSAPTFCFVYPMESWMCRRQTQAIKQNNEFKFKLILTRYNTAFSWPCKSNFELDLYIPPSG